MEELTGEAWAKKDDETETKLARVVGAQAKNDGCHRRHRLRMHMQAWWRLTERGEPLTSEATPAGEVRRPAATASWVLSQAGLSRIERRTCRTISGLVQTNQGGPEDKEHR